MSDLNDPRVFFAAERALPAWNRTVFTLVAFGFVPDRFAPFHMRHPAAGAAVRELSYWLGLAFIARVLAMMVFAIVQYRRVLKTLRPAEIPAGYCTWSGVAVNVAVVAIGIGLLAYLFSEL